MAGANKRSKKVENEESAEEEYESDDSGGYHGQQEIQATFEGRNLEGGDFHGIKQLLFQLFLTSHVDLSQMSDMLINQAGIGSVLKQSCNDSDDEEDVDMVQDSDVFGITSIVNLTSHRETPCVQQFYQMLEEESAKSADVATKSNFQQIISKTNRMALLINERFVNIPSKISAIMLSSLHDEIQRMKKRDKSYDFEYFVMMCKLWKPKTKNVSEIQYSNDEEELFVNRADCTFEFSVAGKSDTGLTGNWQSEDKELIPYRRVVVFKADKFESILNDVQNYVQS